jgi:hypothetical protein
MGWEGRGETEGEETIKLNFCLILSNQQLIRGVCYSKSNDVEKTGESGVR